VTRLELLQSRLPAHPGIQSKDDYISTAVLILLVFMDGEYHFVFQKRAPHIRQSGEICFPGGIYHPEDGTKEQTAIRETIEELGIPEKKIKIIGALDTMLAPMGATIDAFVGVAEIRSLDEISPNKDEVEVVFTVPVSFFENNAPQKYEAILKIHPTVLDEKTGKEIILFPVRELGLPDRYLKPWGGMKHTIYVYKVKQGVIWGITSRFIVDLVKKIKK